MATAYCYEEMPLRFLASLFDIQMCYLVYMRYLWALRVLTLLSGCFSMFEILRNLKYNNLSSCFIR